VAGPPPKPKGVVLATPNLDIGGGRTTLNLAIGGGRTTPNKKGGGSNHPQFCHLGVVPATPSLATGGGRITPRSLGMAKPPPSGHSLAKLGVVQPPSTLGKIRGGSASPKTHRPEANCGWFSHSQFRRKRWPSHPRAKLGVVRPLSIWPQGGGQTTPETN
jgi:hypothetical protein